jgi:hypothetical protein
MGYTYSNSWGDLFSHSQTEDTMSTDKYVVIAVLVVLAGVFGIVTCIRERQHRTYYITLEEFGEDITHYSESGNALPLEEMPIDNRKRFR